MLATMLGNFQQGGIRGKLQLGSAWWFNDHIDGMEEQMRALGNLGALAAFVGMLTDSRSFLSYPRHEYFRRILCNLIGNWVEKGEFTDDPDILKTIICGICADNARTYFGLDALIYEWWQIVWNLPFQIDLKNKVIVITGGGGVICGTFARAGAACGAKTAILDLRKENADKVAAEITAQGGTAMGVAANVLDIESLKAAKKTVNDA